MPNFVTYTWACDKCKAEIDVERTMADYLVPPDACGCGETVTFTKLISRQGKPVKLGGGWHDDLYFRSRPK